MVEERDIRAIYRKIYKFAKLMGISNYTKMLNSELDRLLTNFSTFDIPEREIRKFGELRLYADSVNEEYLERFEKLAEKQRRLEARIK